MKVSTFSKAILSKIYDIEKSLNKFINSCHNVLEIYTKMIQRGNIR